MTIPLSTLIRRLVALMLVATLALSFGAPGALAGVTGPEDTGDITAPDDDDSGDADSSDGDDDTGDFTNETGDDADDDGTEDFTNETGDDGDDDGADDTADFTNETGDDGTDDGGDDAPADDDDGDPGDGVKDLPNTGSGSSNGTGMTEWLAIAGVLLAVCAGFFITRRAPRAG